MHTNIAMCLCLLLSISLGSLQRAKAAECNVAAGSYAEAQQLMAARADDDPFGDETDDSAISDQDFPDPIQGFNRPMYTFNDTMYYYVLKPTAQGFAFILPRPSRVCLANFFYNLSMPIRALNCLFQGRGPDLGVELWRFIINSTAGIGGLFDPAGSFFHLPTYKEDTGLTFGHYGAEPGFYLMIPVLGASSGRDGTGTVFDFAMDPLTYMPVPGLRLLESVIKTSLNPDEYDEIKAASLDPYIAIRNGYLQNRESKIQQ
jgi:phospholipid-binding lipoprotein MlaA